MSSALDTSVISTAGRLAGRDCSGIPFSLSDRLLLKRELLWKKMQEKYKQLEENSLNHESIQIDRLGDCSINCVSTCKEVVPSTHIKLPDESWEDRQKYRKSKDAVQHWVNTSFHGPFSESSDHIFPVLSEQVEPGLPASGREVSLCNSLSDINNCILEHQINCEEYGTSRKSVLKESKNVDIMSATSKEDQTLDKLNQVIFIIQEGQPKKRKRSLKQSAEDYSKNPNSESETLITNNKRSRTIKDSNSTGYFISCNKSPLSGKKNVMPADKDYPLPKKIILKICDKIPMLTTGDFLHSDKDVSVPRKETTLENCNSNPTLMKKECSVGYIKSIRKQMLENCDKGSTAIKMACVATDTVIMSDAGGECQKNLISGKETTLSTGKEVLIHKKEISKENFYSLSLRKGNLSVVKDVPVCRKETFMDTTTQSKQKLLSDTEKSEENCNMYPVSVMEKPTLGCRLEETIESCDTDTTVRSTVMFYDKEASTSRREINIEECDKRRKSLQFRNRHTSTSRTGINAENYSKSRTPRNGKLVSSVGDATVSVTESYVENCYARPSVIKDDALVPRTEENLGDCSGSQILRKNKLLTIDKQVLSTREEILEDVDHSSVSREEKLSDEYEESLQSIRVQLLENGKKNQTLGIEVLVDDDVRDPVARPVFHSVNPTSAREQHCEQNETPRKEILQTPKPAESCIRIKGQENLASKYVDPPTSDEDSVVYSFEDASTIIINPLLSCKYEHLLPEIRKQLENLHENVKEKYRGGPQVTHNEGRTGHNYSCSKRTVLQHNRNSLFTDQRDKRHTLNCDVSHHHPSYVSETRGQSRDDKSYELSGDKEEESDARNGNRIKDVLQYTSLQSEKGEERINNRCDKTGSSESQSMSIRNKSNKESPKHSRESLRFGTNKIKYNHYNSYDKDHGFETNSKREETNPKVLSEHDEGEAEIPDDDDDDIFCYRPRQHSSLHHEKESKMINKKIFCLDSRRSASDNNVSGRTGKSEHCRNIGTVFRDGSNHSAAETYLSVELGHDRIGNIMTDGGKNPEKKHALTIRRKVTRSSNHSISSGCAEYEDDKADDGETTRKGFVLTTRKRKLKTSNHLTESSCAKNDSDNPTKVNVLTRVKSGTATSNQINSEHGENGDIADGDICIFSDDGGGGGGSLEKENVSSKWKRGTKLSDHLTGSDDDKTEYCITDDENPNKENVLTRRKRGTKASNNAVGSKHVENEDDTSNDGENPTKKSVLHKRERQTKTSNHFFSSRPDRNESVFTRGRPNHSENEDKRFYKTHKCSLFDVKGKETTGNICDKENFTSPKLNKTNKIKSSSQSMLTRSSIARESLKCLVRPAVFENENIVESHYSSDESSIGIENLFTDFYRKQFSGDVMGKGARREKSDNIHRLKMKYKLKSSRGETRMVPSAGSEHLKIERELSDDDIFYKTPRHSVFREKEKERMGKICGNENVTSQKSSKTNKYKSFKNNSSHSTLPRNNISREALRHSVKPVVFENKNTVDSDYSSHESSIEIEELLTDSYRQQFSEDVMEKVASSDKSDNTRLKMESELKSSSAETQKSHLTISKCFENEKQVMGHDDDDDDNDDIFYYKNRKQSSCNEKRKE